MNMQGKATSKPCHGFYVKQALVEDWP